MVEKSAARKIPQNAGLQLGRPLVRLTSLDLALEPQDDLSVKAIFSDESVARDGNVWSTAGMDITSYQKNSVLLYAHDADQPPIGRTIVSKDGSKLKGTAIFTPADLNPFGAMIGRMYRDGFLSAFSVSILPTEWRYAVDKNRSPGSLDVTKSDLLEISGVPVPALTTALVTARAFGIDTAPAARWAEQILDQGHLKSSLLQLCAARKAAITPPIFHIVRGFNDKIC